MKDNKLHYNHNLLSLTSHLNQYPDLWSYGKI